MGKARAKSLPWAIPKAQAEALKSAALSDPRRAHATRNYALINVMLHGARNSEARTLRCEDVQLDYIDDKGNLAPQMVIRRGKGDKDRFVPLSEEAARALRQQMTMADGSIRSEGYIFPGSNPDSPISIRPVQKMIRDLALQARIPRADLVTPHVLRHTFAVECLKKGINIVVIQRLLGHGNLATTQKYLLVEGSYVRDEVKDKGLPF